MTPSRVLGAALVAALSGAACLTVPAVATAPEEKAVIEIPIKAFDKVDILFAIDNSASMGDKAALLKEAVPDLLRRLVVPNCVDPSDLGRVLGPSESGRCAQGLLEFEPVKSLHVGVVSSSLGSAGSDRCATKPPGDDAGHLLTRGPSGPVAGAEKTGFLALSPSGAVGTEGLPRLEADFQALVEGVGESGCGFEAQLESWYRFLVQPDPGARVALKGDVAEIQGLDEELLRQRKAFLRPDSLVLIVQITDENDSTVDPRALGGHAWEILKNKRLPRPTAACADAPMSPSCSSCFFSRARSLPECADPSWPEADVAHNADNLRLFEPKRRFGLEPRFPLARYVRALGVDPESGKPLATPTVPDREGEHPGGSADYVGASRCTNPLFASSLPGGAKDERCLLPRGPRTPDMVFFASITGVPHQLLHFDPASAKKSRLTAEDWTRILGAFPESYDFSGVDPHMRESAEARPGLPGPTASDTADPIHGREMDTGGRFLQHACTFALPVPKPCPTESTTCDCDGAPQNPLCDPRDARLQVRAKAYPGLRHLSVAKALGERGIVSSICPIDTKNAAADNKLYGYRPAAKAIVDTLGARLRATCLPRPLKVGTAGAPPCLVVFEHDATGGDEACDHPELGWSRMEPAMREQFNLRQAEAGRPDARSHPVCVVRALTPPGGASCVSDPQAGWCYATGDAAQGASEGLCASAVLFSANTPRRGGTMHLFCIETETAGQL